jgi:hypothetical protein
MNTQMVSWRDYEGVDGFGVQTQEEVDALNKALTAGSAQNPPGSAVAGDGFALRVESLERTLRNTTYKMEHIRLWKSIPKIPAYNTVEEHNVLRDYGVNPDAGFIAEGDLPEADDSTYERKFAVVKYMGTTRRVTHVMSLVKPAHGNVVAQETVNGTMHLLRMVERSLFNGDSTLSPLQFDGYERLLRANSPAANIIDLRGRPLSEDVLMDAALTVQDAPNYGTPTHIYLNPKVKSDLIKTFFPKGRYETLGKGNGDLVGLDIKGFTSPAGDVMFEPDTFITDGGGTLAAAIGDAAKRPSTPVLTTVATTPVDAASQFTADDAGDYAVKVVAANRFGKSAPVTVSAALTVAAGDKIMFGVTPGAILPEWWEVYRSRKNGAAGTERLTIRVANAAGAGESTLSDFNAKIPGTTSAFLFQQNMENMAIKQLAPMVKVPLATVDTSARWMQLIYLVPVLYTPGKNVLFTNVGRATGFVGQP